MPKMALHYCIDVMDHLQGSGSPSALPRQAVERVVALRCGAERKTIAKYVKVLQEFGFMKLNADGTFALNYDRAGELF